MTPIFHTLFLFSVSVGFIWDSDRPTLDYITEVVRSIGTTVKLTDVSMTKVFYNYTIVSMK